MLSKPAKSCTGIAESAPSSYDFHSHRNGSSMIWYMLPDSDNWLTHLNIYLLNLYPTFSSRAQVVHSAPSQLASWKINWTEWPASSHLLTLHDWEWTWTWLSQVRVQNLNRYTNCLQQRCMKISWIQEFFGYSVRNCWEILIYVVTWNQDQFEVLSCYHPFVSSLTPTLHLNAT